jgi:hypothetical protein
VYSLAIIIAFSQVSVPRMVKVDGVRQVRPASLLVAATQLVMNPCNDSRSALFTTSQRFHSSQSISFLISPSTQLRSTFGSIAPLSWLVRRVVLDFFGKAVY